MTLPPYCIVCRFYHAPEEDCPLSVNLLAPLKPTPKEAPSVWRWVGPILIVGMLIVLYLGSCA